MAISLNTRSENADFSFAARFARKLALFLLQNASLLLKVSPLNVNIPALPEDQIKGVFVAKQGSAQLIETFEKRVDPRDNVYYWLAGETLAADTEETTDSDTAALKRGLITITPIHYDLTRYCVMADLNEAIKDLF